jgi:hypothetical protein
MAETPQGPFGQMAETPQGPFGQMAETPQGPFGQMAETPQGPIGQQGPVDKKAGDPKATRQKLSTSAASCGYLPRTLDSPSRFLRSIYWNTILRNVCDDVLAPARRRRFFRLSISF